MAASVLAHVLLVDDEETVLRVLMRLCMKQGHTVIACQSVEMALEAMKGPKPFDLIMTDIVLPGQTGLSFLEWLIRHKVQVGVVVMTAYPDHQTVQFAKENGVLDVLVKPFDNMMWLSKKIAKWTSLKHPTKKISGWMPKLREI